GVVPPPRAWQHATGHGRRRGVEPAPARRSRLQARPRPARWPPELGAKPAPPGVPLPPPRRRESVAAIRSLSPIQGFQPEKHTDYQARTPELSNRVSTHPPKHHATLVESRPDPVIHEAIHV